MSSPVHGSSRLVASTGADRLMAGDHVRFRRARFSDNGFRQDPSGKVFHDVQNRPQHFVTNRDEHKIALPRPTEILALDKGSG